MDNKVFEELVKKFREEQDSLIIQKGHDYTIANQDRLFNFKFVAELVGITPLQVAAVYWLKHVLAISTFVKTGKLESEGIYSRHLDEANYNLLMMAISREESTKLFWANTNVKE